MRIGCSNNTTTCTRFALHRVLSSQEWWIVGRARTCFAQIAGGCKQRRPATKQPRASGFGQARRRRDTESLESARAPHGLLILGAPMPGQPLLRLPLCGARTRAGHPCRRSVIFFGGRKRNRCRNHGGMNPLTRSPETRAKMSEGMRQSWARRKAAANNVTPLSDNVTVPAPSAPGC
jgi:hypothetical protein